MRRFNLPVVTLVMTLAVVTGIAVAGMLASAVPSQAFSVAGALSRFTTQAVLIVALGAAAGLLAWIVVFVAKRDGWHRMEWLAFLPSNYGGKSPFDISEPTIFR